MKKHLILALLATAAPAFPALAQSAAAPYMSASRFDAEGRVTGTISAPEPNGHHLAVRNSFDAAGRLIKVEKGELASWQGDTVAPANWTGFTVFQTIDSSYDAMGRKLTDKLSANGTAYSLNQMSYDGAGRLQCTAVRMNPAAFTSLPADACTLGTQGSDGPDRIVKNVYDAAGRVTVVKKAVGTALEQDYVTYTYTGNSKIATVTDANGGTASMTYDGFDRQARWVFPSKVTAGVSDATDYEEYGYDANSNRTSLRKRDGQTIGFSYDALNRVTAKDLPGTASDVAYSYDLRGLQLAATFSASGQAVSTAYDNAGRITSTTSSAGGSANTLTFQNDRNGNRTQIAFADGATYDSVYDALNRLQSVSQGASAIVSLAYNGQGDRSALTGAGVATSYGYDAAGRLSSMGTDLAGTSGDVTVTFARNASSQITSRASTNDAYAVNNLSSGNKTYSVNGQNEYRTAGGASVTYDANGNLTSDGATTFAYDAENRLVSASGAKNATLTYDPQGRLATITSAGVTTRFVYDGDRMVAEYDGAGNLLRRYVHTNGLDEPVAVDEPLPTVTASIADRQYTTVTALAGGSWQIHQSGGNSSGFLASADSSTPYAGDFTLSARSTGGTPNGFMAMNADPASDVGYTSLDYSIQIYFDGRGYIEESNAYLGNFVIDQKVWIWRRGTTLYYGTGPDFATASSTGLIRTVTGATGTLYFDSSMASVGSDYEVKVDGPATSVTASIADRQWTVVTPLTGGSWQIHQSGGNSSGFWASADSSTPYAGDFTLSARALTGSPNGFFAMNSDPATDVGYTSLDYAAQIYFDGRFYIEESNNYRGSFPIDQKVWIWRRGTALYYGTGPDFATASTTGLVRTVAGATGTLYFDSSFASLGSDYEVKVEGAPSAKRRTLVADERGSIVALADASGNPAAINAYDEYGAPGTANQDRFQYTGQLWSPELGLYYYKARWYNPFPSGGSRFMQVDPTGYKDQVNLYPMGNNDFVNMRDPTGESTYCMGNMSFCFTITGDHFRPSGAAIAATNSDREGTFTHHASGSESLRQAAAEISKIHEQKSGNETAYRMDVMKASSEVDIVMTSKITPTSASESDAALSGQSLQGANGLLHFEPSESNSGVPGEGDWQAPAKDGIVNYALSHGQATEIATPNGIATITPLTYVPGATRRDELQERANEYQKNAPKH
jgi:RHS repeat-associated protein